MIRWQRGDTLVEVTIALSILALILTSAFAVGTKAYTLGVAARERTQAADYMQQQVEAIRNYRDANPWSTLTSSMPTDGTTPYHMKLVGTNWQPVRCDFAPNECINGFYDIEVTTKLADLSSPAPLNAAPYLGNALIITVKAKWDNAGGGFQNTTSIVTHINNLKS